MSTAGPPAVAAALSVRALDAGYGDRTVLQGICLEVPDRGVFGLLGPAGAGKSTLLRTLSRWNDALPSFWRRGEVHLDGEDVLAEPQPDAARRRLSLLVQKGRLYTATVLENAIADSRPDHPLARQGKLDLARRVMVPWGLWEELEGRLDAPVVDLSIGQQRRLAVARLLASEPRFLLLDEPARDLSDDEPDRMLDLLTAAARRLPLLLCTHNQAFARRIADRVCLLAGGRVVECATAEEFFDEPRTREGRDYRRLGNCWPTLHPTGEAPDPEGGGAEEAVEEPVEEAVQSGERGAAEVTPGVRPRRPSELHWVVEGRLGGCQQPGLLGSLEEELAGLTSLGCDLLVSLREEVPAADRVRAHGMEAIHFPIVDMGVPEPAAAADLCRRLWDHLDGGGRVVLHCKAGLGRTGTLLACMLVHRGAHPVRAVEEVRSVNPRYIQSDAQFAFIETFASFLRPATPGTPS